MASSSSPMLSLVNPPPSANEVKANLPDSIRNNFPSDTYKYFKTANKQALPFVEYSWPTRLLRGLGYLLTFYLTTFSTKIINTDEVGLALDSEGKPKLLGPGWHMLFPLETSLGKKKLSDSYIAAGSLKIISVKKGEVSYCMDTATGEQSLLTEGRHVIDSPTMVCKGFINFNDPSKIYNPITGHAGDFTDTDLRIVRVETGKKGVLNRAGKLEILDTGLHVIAPPDKFSHYVSVAQEILELPSTIIESKDYVPLKIKADVFYKIENPLIALTDIGANIVKFITDKAKATIMSIIRSQSYMSVAQDKTATYARRPGEHKGESLSKTVDNDMETGVYPNPPASAPLMTVKTVHDEFMEQINADVMRTHGIDISNIRIEAMEIANPELAKQFASQAEITAKTQTQITNLQAQAQIQHQNALNAANTRQIEAQTQAQALKLAADAKSYSIEKEAEANAKAQVIAAEAEKQRLILEGQGKEQYAQSISSHPFMQTLMALEAQGKALQGATVNFSQIPSGFGQSPFGLFSANACLPMGQQPQVRGVVIDQKLEQQNTSVSTTATPSQ